MTIRRRSTLIGGRFEDPLHVVFRDVVDQFDVLYADSRKQPRVMGVPLHPMISGQPLRIKHLQRAIAHMREHPGVWFATGSEIIDAYQNLV